MSLASPGGRAVRLGLALCAIALVPAARAAAFAACPQNFYQGIAPRDLPAQPGKQRELCFDGFAVLHSGESKTPLYVAEHLSAQRLQGAGLKRSDRFYEEARLPASERARLEDYRAADGLGQRYDRGHLAPAADMHTPTAMAQSFSLANMAPQRPALNRGPWARSVELATRKYVQRTRRDVYVLTGPVFQGARRTLGPGRVWIPSHFFKLVFDPGRGEAWAYWVENREDARASRPISYAELVRRTGMRFIPALPVQ
ncbi:MAG: DNA/RNA non-specific endonuclease [Candidatus Dactylopiibacterium sp.]|nr:DNA/RNA non-specific endonuclease [Candidatus Dactylopiibacterium sp.]